MSGFYASVDLGGTTINVAIAKKDGRILQQESIATNAYDGPEKILNRIGDFVLQLAQKARLDRGNLTGIGIGVPGLVDLPSGVTKFLPNLLTHWRDVPVGQTLSDLCGCRVRVLNDVRMATLGELTFGHGRDVPNLTMAFFSLGTGVGGGIAIDGRLRLGPLGAAGELGHQTIIPDGPRCGCGNRGCLESLASGPAMVSEAIRLMRLGLAPKLNELVDGNIANVTTREMMIAADHDDSIREAIVNAATFIGIAAANVVSTIHPSLIVLGGGVAEMGSILTSTVKSVITQRVGMFPVDDVQVVQSKLGANAGLLGGVALAALDDDWNNV